MIRRSALVPHWWWIPATAALVVCGLSIGQMLAPPKPLEIHLHPGGVFTLGAHNGREITPAEIQSWKRAEIPEPHIILDTPPEATISSWNPLLVFCGELGLSNYQIRLGGQTFNCHLPGDCCSGRSDLTIPSKIIDLRKREDAPYPTEQNDYDVQVLVDRSTTWGEFFQHTALHRPAGVSMMIDLDGGIFLRERDEDEQHRAN
ncbi:hypothetical protein [Luteolibacter luteus]|uniref:Uncharacterized protein n=1 Tax=Luteolibacter luteus TaxID=2728835 RepID=A0A858RNA9_9BACT|nr:hypothetical protein [Luteolibacter luteus]QJE98352.1 hypothetical protein HHL09_22055 [Luteolibacter luteus]